MINSASTGDLSTRVMSLSSEIQLKISELRQEFIKKFSDFQHKTTELLIKKASNEEMRIV